VNSFIARIPPLILIGSLALVVWTVYMLIRMFWESIRLSKHFNRLLKSWTGVAQVDRKMQVSGLDDKTFDAVRQRCNSVQGIANQWWKKVEECIERYTSPEDQNGWFVTRPIREILTHEELVASNYHGQLYGSFPGILTGVGLMLTFLAILIALMDVNYDAANGTFQYSSDD